MEHNSLEIISLKTTVMKLDQECRGFVRLLDYLQNGSTSPLNPGTLEKLEASCPGLVKVSLHNRKPLVATLTFPGWDDAVKAVIGLWELRLQDVHNLTPELSFNDSCSHECKITLEQSLKEMFLSHISQLEEGAAVQICQKELDALGEELRGIREQLKKRNSLDKWQQLSGVKQDLLLQISHLSQQLSEFIDALKSLQLCVALRCYKEDNNFDEKDIVESPLFKLKNSPTWWHQLHCLLQREIQRLNARLPLYAKRSNIIHAIENNQVIVLIGETGSGKSTQLVQYLADAGYANNGKSIACTQPRRVAVTALARYVSEESQGCSNIGYIASPTLRFQETVDIIYLSDYMLLKFCLSDLDLNEFSCILVDEAHERNINTDLVLAILKKSLSRRRDLKLVIMSATANADLLLAYFGGCRLYNVRGRSFPVEFVYEADDEHPLQSIQENQGHPSRTHHVCRVVEKVAELNAGKTEGNILAFLPSQAEVEWACTRHFGSNALVFPLHGRLQHKDQQSVFQITPRGMRKIIFATNVAETSITIPDVKFVVDCGLAKESFVDPLSGINYLRVCPIDQSAAIQRAGRAGRTQEGICFRLYSLREFEAMTSYRTPEILRVHLGVAILKLLALGVKDIECFDFIQSPPSEAISLAVKGLKELGALEGRPGEYQLTALGLKLVKLGIDPRLGCIVLRSVAQGLGMEGLVVAGLLSCTGNIFFRAGSDEEKDRSDRLKMRFCHVYGDILTLLSVYQEWDAIHHKHQNNWCVNNSINSKSMRRCKDIMREIKWCLRNELDINVPAKWVWSMFAPEEYNVTLRKIILSAMSSNLAVFSGCNQIGYDIISSGSQACLHPSSSVLIFGRMPEWVVFGELLCTTREFLTSVTVIEPEWLSELYPHPSFDICLIQRSRLKKVVIPNLSKLLLDRICGKQNKTLKQIVDAIKHESDHRCLIEPDFQKQELQIYATSEQIEKAESLIFKALKRERRWMKNQCIEKCLFDAGFGKSSPAVLFGAGAEIRQMLMLGEFVSVKVYVPDPYVINEIEILEVFDRCSDGIAGYYKDSSPSENLINNERLWGIVTFCSMKGADEAINLLNGAKVAGQLLKLIPLIRSNPIGKHIVRFPAIQATLAWPRRKSKGYALIQCAENDRDRVIRLSKDMLIGESHVYCRYDKNNIKKIFIGGLGEQVSESQIAQALKRFTGCVAEDVFIPHHQVGSQPSAADCEASLVQELKRFVPDKKFQVIMRHSDPKDYNFVAHIKFDQSEHENAAKAIADLQGRALQCCESWQRITCKQNFYSTFLCPRLIFSTLKPDLYDLVQALRQQNKGVDLELTINDNGACFVKITSDNIHAVAGCKSALEKLMEGIPLRSELLDSNLRQFIHAKEGYRFLRSIEMQTKTTIIYDKRNATFKIHGPADKKNTALEKLIKALQQIQELNKHTEIPLLGESKPFGLMREVVQHFGADLLSLKEMVPGAWVVLDHRRHSLFVQGSMDDVATIEKKVREIVQSLRGVCNKGTIEGVTRPETCAICFCDFEDKYLLEGCGHGFCRSCLKNQISSAVRHREGFPLKCAYEGCSQPFLISDFEALLKVEELEELLKVAVSVFVALSRDKYRFCTTPDCPGVYRVSVDGQLFTCGSCFAQLCTTCHIEYHLGLTCEQYKEFKQDPDASLKAWRKGKQYVKNCPSCRSVIEKVDGCNHITCKCLKHLCWLCLESFVTSESCYNHLQDSHGGLFDE